MLRVIIWQDPNTILHDIYTPRLRSFKRSPTHRKSIGNQSPTCRRPIAAHLQSIGNQSPNSRRPVPDWSPILKTVLAPTKRPPVPNWSASNRRLIYNQKVTVLIALWLLWLQLFFGRKAVANRLQCLCDRGFTARTARITTEHNNARTVH